MTWAAVWAEVVEYLGELSIMASIVWGVAALVFVARFVASEVRGLLRERRQVEDMVRRARQEIDTARLFAESMAPSPTFSRERAEANFGRCCASGEWDGDVKSVFCWEPLPCPKHPRGGRRPLEATAALAEKEG